MIKKQPEALILTGSRVTIMAGKLKGKAGLVHSYNDISVRVRIWGTCASHLYWIHRSRLVT